jgi:hypothetical protein
MDLVFTTTADKAVKAILPFLKELSKEEWWNRLLDSWINFEVKGPPKSVILFYFILFSCSHLSYYSDSQLTIALVRWLYG